MSIEALIETLKSLPEPLVRQVGDYVDFLRERYGVDSFNHQWFWNLIELVDKDETPVGDRFAALEKELRSMPIARLEQFIKARDHYLRQIDGPAYHEASQTGHSADRFLFARAGVVTSGKSQYQQVLENPATFPEGTYSEALITIPEDIFESRTGRPTDLGSGVLYESFTNERLWGEGAISQKFGKPKPKHG